MILLKQTDGIKKDSCKLIISEKQDKHLRICQVECIDRNNKWKQLFPSIYAGYAMLLDKYLIDLPGKFFMVYQINEHSRGGHYEYETHLLNLDGKIINQFSSNYHSEFLAVDKYLWFLKSGEKRFDFTSDRDLDLVKLNINTGAVKQTIKLNYPDLLKCSYSHVWGVKLTEKRKQGCLTIEYKNNLKEMRKKRIPLSQI